MALKRGLVICLFVGLTLALPALLYLDDADLFYRIGNIIDGDGSCEEGLSIDKQPDLVIDFSTYIYGSDKAEFVAAKQAEWRELAEKRAEEEAKAKEEAEAKARAEAAASRASEQGTAGSSISTSQKEQQMLSLVNAARTNNGLSALTLNSQLTSTARAKSRDMIDNNYFSHTSPRYGPLSGLLRHHGISYRSAGENLAMNSSGSVSAAHNSLMASPGHRKNIMNSSFSQVGIGIQVKGDGSHYYTQLFIGN